MVGHVSDWITTTVAIVNQTKYYFLDGRRIAMRKGDKVFYLYGDHLGSTSLTTNENGEVVSEDRYLPYGDGRWHNGISPTDFGFTDQRNEVGLGLMDYNARYYDPYLGRFISPDTIVPEPESSSGLNRYRYTRNNPLKYVDPSGHQECEGATTCDRVKRHLSKRLSVQDEIDMTNRIGGGIGTLALGYDLAVAQAAINNRLEGQTFQEAIENARAETNRSFGIVF